MSYFHDDDGDAPWRAYPYELTPETMPRLGNFVATVIEAEKRFPTTGDAFWLLTYKVDDVDHESARYYERVAGTAPAVPRSTDTYRQFGLERDFDGVIDPAELVSRRCRVRIDYEYYTDNAGRTCVGLKLSRSGFLPPTHVDPAESDIKPLLPRGWYDVEVFDADDWESMAGARYRDVCFRVTGGPHEGHPLLDRIPSTAMAGPRARAIFRSFGLGWDCLVGLEPLDLVGRRSRVLVDHVCTGSYRNGTPRYRLRIVNYGSTARYADEPNFGHLNPNPVERHEADTWPRNGSRRSDDRSGGTPDEASDD